jgi:hypothetical protein
MYILKVRAHTQKCEIRSLQISIFSPTRLFLAQNEHIQSLFLHILTCKGAKQNLCVGCCNFVCFLAAAQSGWITGWMSSKGNKDLTLGSSVASSHFRIEAGVRQKRRSVWTRLSETMIDILTPFAYCSMGKCPVLGYCSKSRQRVRSIITSDAMAQGTCTDTCASDMTNNNDLDTNDKKYVLGQLVQRSQNNQDQNISNANHRHSLKYHLEDLKPKSGAQGNSQSEDPFNSVPMQNRSVECWANSAATTMTLDKRTN